MLEGDAISITSVTDLLGNDTDADGDDLTLSGVSSPSKGTLIDNKDGIFTYKPYADFSGVDYFTYTITDNYGGTAVGKAIIVVAPVDNPHDAFTDTDSGDITDTDLHDEETEILDDLVDDTVSEEDILEKNNIITNKTTSAKDGEPSSDQSSEKPTEMDMDQDGSEAALSIQDHSDSDGDEEKSNAGTVRLALKGQKNTHPNK